MKMLFVTRLTFLALIPFALAACNNAGKIHASHEESCKENKEIAISIKNGWVRAAPAGRKLSAAYFTICNNANNPDRLEKISSPVSATSEMHESRRSADDIVSMVPLKNIDIENKDSVTLKQGGKHIMLIGLNKPLEEGDEVTLDLYFTDSGKMTVTLPVRENNHPQSNHDGHKDHH